MCAKRRVSERVNELLSLFYFITPVTPEPASFMTVMSYVHHCCSGWLSADHGAKYIQRLSHVK